MQNIDKFLITFFLGVEENGNYALVYDFIHNSLYMVMGALGLASLPRIVNVENENNQVVHFNKYIELFYIICIPILFSFLSIIKELNTIFNEYGYKITEFIIIFVIISTFIHGINSFIYSQAIQLLEKTNIIIIPSLLAIVINIIMNFILLPKIGVLSAAISSLIAFLISNIILYLAMKKKAKIQFYPKVLYLLIIIGVITMLITNQINCSSVYINLILKGLLVTTISIYVMYIFIKKHIKL